MRKSEGRAGAHAAGGISPFTSPNGGGLACCALCYSVAPALATPRAHQGRVASSTQLSGTRQLVIVSELAGAQRGPEAWSPHGPSHPYKATGYHQHTASDRDLWRKVPSRVKWRDCAFALIHRGTIQGLRLTHGDPTPTSNSMELSSLRGGGGVTQHRGSGGVRGIMRFSRIDHCSVPPLNNQVFNHVPIQKIKNPSLLTVRQFSGLWAWFFLVVAILYRAGVRSVRVNGLRCGMYTGGSLVFWALSVSVLARLRHTYIRPMDSRALALMIYDGVATHLWQCAGSVAAWLRAHPAVG